MSDTPLLAHDLASALTLLHSVVATQQRQGITQVEMLGRMTDMLSRQNDTTHELERVTKVLIEGNGQPSIIVRMALAEHNMALLAADCREMKRISDARTLEEGKQKWQLAAAVVSGVLALISVAITGLIATGGH